MESSKQKRLLIISIIVLAILNIAVLSTFWFSSKSQHHPPKQGHHQKRKHDKGLKILTKKLNLSDEQNVIFRELRESHFGKTQAIHLNIKNKKDEFFKQMTNKNVEDSIVIDLINQAAITSSELDKALFEHYKELMANCNAEQQKKLRSIFFDMIKQKHPKNN